MAPPSPEQRHTPALRGRARGTSHAHAVPVLAPPAATNECGDVHAAASGDHAIAQIAAAQYGIVARAQLIASGLGRGAIDHRLANARLHRVHRGVYAVGHPALAPLAREFAAVLACGEGAVLSHRSAAHVWELHPAGDGDVDVTVASRDCGRRPGLRVHRTGELDPRDVRRRHRIPITAPARTLLDLAEVVPYRELERAVDEAQARGLARRKELLRLLARARGRRGVARLRALLDREEGPALTRSEAEERLLALVRAACLPTPAVNARIAGYEVDFLWRDERLVVEVDGYAFHSGRRAFERDRLRDADLQAIGFRVVRVTWRQIVDEPEALIARLAQALAVARAA